MMHDNDEIVTNKQGGKQSKLEYAFELLEPMMLKRVAHVLWVGKNKYGAKNWQKITDPKEHLGRAMYHVAQAIEGTDHSEDHMANAICRLMFAMWQSDRELVNGGTRMAAAGEFIAEWLPVTYVVVCTKCSHVVSSHVKVGRYNDQLGGMDPEAVSCMVCGCQEVHTDPPTVVELGSSLAEKDTTIEGS